MNTEELLHALVAQGLKVAAERGEEWRLQHPEFMDALQAGAEIFEDFDGEPR